MRFSGLLLAGVLAATPLAAGESAPPGLVATVGRFQKLRVDDQSAAVSNLRLAHEHLVCQVSAGRASYVKAGDEIVGLFVEGSGTVEYVSADPIEAPVIVYVAKKSTSLSTARTDAGTAVRDRFTKLLWLASGDKAPELTGLEARPLTASFDAHREKFSKKRGRTFAVDFASQRLAAPGAPFAWVEMGGGSEDLIYEAEGVANPSERLSFLHGSASGESSLKDMLFSTTLSHQPTDRDPRDPPKPRVVLTDVDLEVKASAGEDVSLTVVETLVPQREALGVFRFALENGIYTTFGAHLSARREHLRQVTDEGGRPLAFYHGDGEVLVQTREPVAANQPVKLKFEIDGNFLVRPGGSNYWELGVRPWFPQPETWEQFYTLHAVVRVKKPFVPFAQGRTIRRAEEGDENVVETRIENPIQFAVVLAGDYSYKEEVRDGVTIRVATYALKNDRAVKQLTDLAAAIIGFYREFLGPFPFPEFNILEIDSYGFGQAPAGVMFITKEAFNPTGGTEENQLYSGGVNERFAHEIAHQYWGHVVKAPSDEEDWLSESFAEYCAALFMKAARGESTYKMIVGHWKAGASFAADKAPIPLADRVYLASDARSQYFIRTGLLYDKGPFLLYALNRELGDETFLTFLKSYQKSFRWKFGSTKTIASFLQFLTKKDYGPFFEQNYWGLGMPKE